MHQLQHAAIAGRFNPHAAGIGHPQKSKHVVRASQIRVGDKLLDRHAADEATRWMPVSALHVRGDGSIQLMAGKTECRMTGGVPVTVLR